MKYQVCRDLTPIEYAALKADIAENGVLVPVELDENGDILDGHHRIRAWQELRDEGTALPDYPRMVRSGMTEEQKRNHARKLNVLRRHMTREEREQLMVDMRQDGMSYPAIGAAVGVSPMTAYRAIEKSGLTNDKPVIGSDGKTYPAQQQPKPPPPFPVPTILDGAHLVSGPLGSYWLTEKSDTKQCAKCGQLWAVAIDYCPYCNLSQDMRIHFAETEQRKENGRSYPLTAANHMPSLDPNYDGDEWYTPMEYIEAAREVMGEIDMDPASSPEAQAKIGARSFLTKDDDALRDDVQWHGRVWLNPPYSMPLIRTFVSKLIAEYDQGRTSQAIILTNNSSDTGWFHDLLTRFPACFTRGRVQFWRADSSTFGARQGQTFFYLGDNPSKFRTVFSRFGVVVERV